MKPPCIFFIKSIFKTVFMMSLKRYENVYIFLVRKRRFRDGIKTLWKRFCRTILRRYKILWHIDIEKWNKLNALLVKIFMFQLWKLFVTNTFLFFAMIFYADGFFQIQLRKCTPVAFTWPYAISVALIDDRQSLIKIGTSFASIHF